jgi:phage terminase Nu1 subunit (DNA packaging protein)
LETWRAKGGPCVNAIEKGRRRVWRGVLDVSWRRMSEEEVAEGILRCVEARKDSGEG